MKIDELRTLAPDKKNQFIQTLDKNEIIASHFDWSTWARPQQLEPEGLGKNGKYIWFVKSGRGFGKTRMFAEWVIDKVKNHGYKYVSLVGAASDEVRDIMIEGESGLLACSPPWFYPEYIPSKKKITWPNGAVARIFYGSEPDKSRGAQSDLVWMDELSKWKYPEDTFDNLILGCRLGSNPLCGVSSTPRPTVFIKKLTSMKECIVTGGHTRENIANLSPVFINTIIKKYEGTRLGRQELEGAILDDNPNALWLREWLDKYRVFQAPDCYKMAVGVDPQASSSDNEHAETGIIVAGEGKALPGMKYPDDPHYYVFGDLTINGRPEQWGGQVIAGYNQFDCSKIIAEKNQGGDMVKSTIKNIDQKAPVELVWASKGKYTRAEPISLLYEQGRVHHVGTFGALEDQLCEWTQGEQSPDRLDALVWVLTYLSQGIRIESAPNTLKQRSRTKGRSVLNREM